VNERQLLHDYKINGNVASLQSLVLLHTPFVKFVAKRYWVSDNDYKDLIQEGILGLIQAINKFDLNRPNKLITYAVYWIRMYISRYLRSQYKYTAVDFGDELEYNGPSPETEAIKSGLHDRINEAAYEVRECADSREKEIFAARYRMDKVISFQELGERYGITRQRACVISNGTIDKIRKGVKR
jgi:RNA polymerase primary sigma factor